MKNLVTIFLLLSVNSFAQTTGCPPPVISYTINCGDDSTQLTASPGFGTYSWSPATGLSNPSISNPMAIVAGSTTYTLTTTTTTELLVNGNFGLGNTGFTSALNFTSFYSPGNYYVAPTFFTTAYSMGDHTPTPDEMFMSVDGISTLATLWQENIPVISPSTNYTFSFWGTDCNVNPPIYEMHFIGNVTGDVIVATTTGTLGAGVWNWGDYGVPVWNSGPNTSVTIKIINLELNGYGNDFGLDDFSFTTNCTSSATVTISNNPLTANFSADTVCAGLGTTFTDHSTGGTPASWSWNFGDGSTSTVGPVTTHIYTTGGTYTASLIVANSSGCADTILLPVIVNVSPTANYSSDTVCFGSATTFTDASSGSISLWSWNFDDGSAIVNTTNATHVYASPGSYGVTHTVASTNGCTNSMTDTIVVDPMPVATFTSTNTCVMQSSLFTDNSTGSPTSWSWTLGDGSVSTIQDPAHLYSSSGNYTVTLVVNTDHGCTDTSTQTITVYQKPNASFTSNIVCSGASTTFTNTSTTPDGTIASAWWNFGDGTTSSVYGPDHVLGGSSTSFNVTMAVITLAGCVDTVMQTVTTDSLPVAGFSDVLDEETLTAEFTDLSTGATSWTWDMGDGGTNNIEDPVHTFPAPGSYLVIQTAINQYGCTDTAQQLIHFTSESTIFIPNAFTPNGNGMNDVFIPKFFGITQFRMLIFDRWGNQLFDTQDMNQGWNGKYKGKLVEEDLYVYKIYTKDLLHNDHSYMGTITIVK